MYYLVENRMFRPGVHFFASGSDFSRMKAAALPPSIDFFASSNPKSWISFATIPVQPVWWLAPSPPVIPVEVLIEQDSVFFGLFL